MLSAAIARLLQEIDFRLQSEKVPIPFRPMHAMSRVADHLQQPPIGSFLAEINEWFTMRYGTRLRGATRLGRIPVALQDDVHILVLGPWTSLIDGSTRPALAWGIDAGPRFLQSLSRPELAEIDDLLGMGFRCFSELCATVSEKALSQAATADLDTAVDELLRPARPETGLSKWASYMAAEKSLKEFIRAQGGNPPKRHGIFDMHQLALRYGLCDIRGISIREGFILDLLDTSPGVRYGETPVLLADALGAYYASLILCAALAVRLRLERGGRNWLSPAITSPATFVARRLCEIGGVPRSFVDLWQRTALTQG